MRGFAVLTAILTTVGGLAFGYDMQPKHTPSSTMGAGVMLGSANTSSLPSQTGNSGKYLTTDGSAASWATVGGGAASSLVSSDTTPIPITINGSQVGRWFSSGALNIGTETSDVSAFGQLMVSTTTTTAQSILSTGSNATGRSIMTLERYRGGTETGWQLTENILLDATDDFQLRQVGDVAGTGGGTARFRVLPGSSTVTLLTLDGNDKVRIGRDLVVTGTTTSGLIQKSADGTCHKLVIANDNSLSATTVTCP